jgi:hypothetical protein
MSKNLGVFGDVSLKYITPNYKPIGIDEDEYLIGTLPLSKSP